ncbi:hypothetical protein HRS9122_04991 [Pyrenophora teres f. teres]|nr:hypothetical protein HRS9122_04991 [Pyrenophora teres f. teres]
MDTPPRVFETAVGKFWRYQGTSNYMKSRNELIMALGKINTKLAVQVALDHALDLIRLNPQDSMYVRSCVPTLFLRLGRDQECYSFCKWWVTVGQDYDYDWKDTQLPHHIMKNVDALEPVDAFERVRDFTRPDPNNRNVPSFSDLPHVVAVMLVKIRMLLTLQAIEDPAQASHPSDTGKGTSPTYMSPIIKAREAGQETIRCGEADQRAFLARPLETILHFTVSP